MYCLLVDLDTRVSTQLQSALSALGCSITTKAPAKERVDIVFSAAEAPTWPGVLRNASESHVPVVAVGTEPTEYAWLEALESGASDYLCTGFELAELRWILQGIGISNRRGPALGASTPIGAAA